MNFSTISKDFPLILASSSPRRKKLLSQIGIPFHPRVSNIDENMNTATSPFSPRKLAVKKAKAVYSDLSKNWILGADTVVMLGEALIGKPKDSEEAKSTLVKLNGKDHKVITGFCLLDPTGEIGHMEEITTFVKVKKLTAQEITAYIATSEPFGKAGSYGIQGIGAFMVEAITGSYSNVVGLPLCALIKALRRTGALEAFPIPS